MLATLFRGVILLGVVGWYSAYLWKAVDNYFKGQFKRYLDEEYQRNPRMREDVQAYATVDKSESSPTDIVTEAQRILEACERETCTIDRVGLGEGGEKKSVPALTVDELRKEVARATELPAAFRDSSVAVDIGTPGREELPAATELADKEEIQSLNEKEVKSEMKNHQQEVEEKPLVQIEHDGQNFNPQSKQEQSQEKTPEKYKKNNNKLKRLKMSALAKHKINDKIKIGAETEKASKRKKNTKEEVIQRLSYTREDYDRNAWEQRFTGKERDDYRDFVEFEDETDRRLDEMDEDDDGIPISALPFKPAIDVYDLDWISINEFCPLTLDESATCDELKSWG